MVETTSKAIIDKLRQQFARHGIPLTLVTDNSPQFVSDKVCQFSKRWEFEHRTSSPYHLQSNGKAQSAVKVVKQLMMKALADGRDPWLSLLESCNTPTEGMSSSPAQRLLSRRTRALLPMKNALLRRELVTEASKQWRRRQAKYYERSKGLNCQNYIQET